jgi:hypothetical protein
MNSRNRLELSMSFTVFLCVRIIGEITVTLVIRTRDISLDTMDFYLWQILISTTTYVSIVGVHISLRCTVLPSPARPLRAPSASLRARILQLPPLSAISACSPPSALLGPPQPRHLPPHPPATPSRPHILPCLRAPRPLLRPSPETLAPQSPAA